MDILNRVIASLTKDEIRYFKIYAKRMVDSEERKDFQLFDYIRKNPETYNEEDIALKLYGNTGKDAFYRLKNRLAEYLGDYLTLHHSHRNEQNELNRLLSLFNIFYGKGQIKVAHFYLKKAEQKAQSSENFELLDIIYGSFVKLSGDLIEINPEDYINNRRENVERLNKIRETDQALAAIAYRLKVTQNFSAGKTDTLRILDKTIKEFTSDVTLKKSKSFQTRIYRAVSQILLQQHNYAELEKYIKETLQHFEKEKWFNAENHEVKLQMLTFLVNSLFRNAKYSESLNYAETLGKEIKAFHGVLYDKFLFFYYNSLVINYTALDKKKALATLEEFERETRNKENSYYDQFLYFNKAMILHQLGKPTDAIRNIVKLYVNDYYKKADEAFKLKISVAELIMHFDAGDPGSYLPRAAAVKKQFRKLLNEGDFKREKQVIGFLDKMTLSLNYRSNKKLKPLVVSFVKADPKGLPAGTEIINYGAWLATKWNIST